MTQKYRVRKLGLESQALMLLSTYMSLKRKKSLSAEQPGQFRQLWALSSALSAREGREIYRTEPPRLRLGGGAAISGSSVLAIEKSPRWHPTPCATFRQYQALVETGWFHLKWVRLFTKVWTELENKNSPKSRKKASWV